MKEISFALKQKILSVLFVLLSSVLLIFMGDPVEMGNFLVSLFSKEGNLLSKEY